MTESTTRRTLRVCLRIQIVLICAMLLVSGVSIAAARTETTARGIPAAVQTDKPAAPSVVVPDELLRSDWREFAGLLPAPVGNLFSLYFSIRNIDKQELYAQFGKLHSFFMQYLSFR